MVNYESHLGEKTGNNKEMTKADQPLEKLKEAEVNFQIDRNETKFRKETEEIRVNDVYDNIESYLQTDDANDDVALPEVELVIGTDEERDPTTCAVSALKTGSCGSGGGGGCDCCCVCNLCTRAVCCASSCLTERMACPH